VIVFIVRTLAAMSGSHHGELTQQTKSQNAKSVQERPVLYVEAKHITASTVLKTPLYSKQGISLNLKDGRDATNATLTSSTTKDVGT
jgi:hypothetical protein